MRARLPLLLVSPLAHAAFVDTDQVFVVGSPPPSVEEGLYENQTQLGAWVEVERLTLPVDVAVDIATPGTYGPAGSPINAPGTLPAGTQVISHYFHGDSTGQSIASWDGYATFDTPILGIQIQQTTMEQSDDLFNVGGVVFDTQSQERDFDTDLRNDFLIWDPADPYTIRFDHAADTGMDEFRVITAAYHVEIAGTCPGTLDIRWGGMTPGGDIAFITSPDPLGTFTVPVVACQGTVLDLGTPPALRALVSAGAQGYGDLSPSVQMGALCSHSVQVVDMSSCTVSNVVPLP
jgi:hypothetical protein